MRNLPNTNQDAVHPVTREVRRLKGDFLLETGAWYVQVVDSASSDANAEVGSYIIMNLQT